MQKDKLKLRNKLAGADEKKRHLVRNQKFNGMLRKEERLYR